MPDEPNENLDRNISIIDLDQIDDDSDDVVEIIDLRTPEKTKHFKKKMISTYLEEQAAAGFDSAMEAADVIGLSESYIIEELGRFEAENPNIGGIMDELYALLSE